ncbi:MAG: endonuclease domain-containing protein [Phyllobacteriaceae bacterium]|nr:endonuclease domain-containing protein [Phyllobacteriaceae bacterium]
MPTGIQPKTIARARSLRRSMTDGEAKLWSELREFRRLYGIHVRKQAPIGPFIADFVVHERKLVIEVDGQFHFEPERMAKDQARDAWLNGQGYRVVRLTTGDLETAFDGCVEEILRALGLME